MIETIGYAAFPLAFVLAILLIGVIVYELVGGCDGCGDETCSVCNLETPKQKMIGDSCCWCDRDSRKVDERV